MRLGPPGPHWVSRNVALLVAAILVVVFGAVAQILRPVPVANAVPVIAAQSTVGGAAPVLPWPAHGAGALVVEGLGQVASYAAEVPRPMASVAKVMTALVILQDHPLAPQEQGPTIQVSASDTATYEQEARNGDSVVAVVAGERLTEYQALQALLLPSANNIALLLADWDAGSETAFVTRMNATAVQLGAIHTRYADSSGLSASDVSTPGDLIRVAERAMTMPAFAEIVGQAHASLPVAGEVDNLDTLIGHDGFIGVKTGTTIQAGACFVFAAQRTLEGRTFNIYGAVMGQPSLDQAFALARALVDAMAQGLHVAKVLTGDQVIATYRTPWGAQSAVTATSLSWLAYDGMKLNSRVELDSLQAPVEAGTRVGTLWLQLGDQQTALPLRLKTPLPAPDMLWRLSRPL